MLRELIRHEHFTLSSCVWLDTASQSRPLVSIFKKKPPATGKGTPVATKQQKTQPPAEESPVATDEKGDAEDINIEILKRWVQGAGRQPATWRTLIKVLKLSGLCALAEEIEDKIKYTYVVD